jgi:di/tricarboxylate transporter
MMSASLAFATPFGYQTNMMVYGPGGYHFTDFLRVGIPMDIVTATTAILIIPIVWPF